MQYPENMTNKAMHEEQRMEFKDICVGCTTPARFRKEDLAFADKSRYIKELEEHADRVLSAGKTITE